MGLNASKGNMYEWVTHTWNVIKGSCYHDCTYCYMKRWGGLKTVRFDEKELKTDLGQNNTIFVGSSCDMWSEVIPDGWIELVIKKCEEHQSNRYLFQTKNPARFKMPMFLTAYHCITLETNRHYKEIMGNSPSPQQRVDDFASQNKARFITIEPIMDFDIEPFVEMIKKCSPIQVNIGADSSRNMLPEPPKEKVAELIFQLQKFTQIHRKRNLERFFV